MSHNRKVPEKTALKWIVEFDKLKKGLKIDFSNFIIEKTTWIELSGANNLNRIRVYFGLEYSPSGKPSGCAYAVGTLLDGSGVYRDQISKIFKLDPKNIEVTSRLEDVKKHLKAWNEWRNGKHTPGAETQKKTSAKFPVAFLLHSDDLIEIYSKPGNSKVKLEFAKNDEINLLMSGEALTRSIPIKNEYFDFINPCPPICDPESLLIN